MDCPECSRPVLEGSRYCAFCGRAVVPSSALPTVNVPSSSGARSRGDARFVPGEILAGRFRIVGLLGKGGMGEVYRADDLKLGQAVALKFLPPGFESDPDRLQRFLDEVRTARQVSHANVCRIYDAGEADGHHFLSMEYVDGEDLASLLRRIGHLPRDKAIQIARQLCAGLAASHAIGVIHRDLKPSNVMIDGRGRARITDFGLAAFAEGIAGNEIRSGTPAYMAPEQLAGREVTAKSDVYALGLVLYELFTGKRAFEPGSKTASFAEGLDPAVERVILRCLEESPGRRPASALAVAAALPGADPLAAALAAGETPSPEMIAEAGDKGAAPAVVTWGALAVFVAAVVALFFLAQRTTLLGLVPLDKPPEFLQERAREILAQAGHDSRAADSLFAFAADVDYLDDIRRGEGGLDRWEVLRSSPPSAVRFWYRESPSELTAQSPGAIGTWLTDPPNDKPGMARVGLDIGGRLVSYLVVPAERLDATVAPEPDWQPLLRATGVDPATLTAVPSEWAPPVFADRRAAWTGSWPGRPGTVRIETAAAGGKPVSLRIVDPWTRAAEQPPPARGFWNQASRMADVASFVIVLVVASIVALRNVRRGRGDRRGALRLALYVGAVRMVWLVGAHHHASAGEREVFVSHLSYAMQRVAIVYVFYLALEPYARRLWPRMLVSWVRVLEGRFRDPLVARDLLIGGAAGAVVAVLARLQVLTPQILGGVPAVPDWTHWTLEPLRGTASTLATLFGIHTEQLLEIIYPLTLLLIFRLLLRRTWAALAAVSLVALVLFWPESGGALPYLVTVGAALVLGWIVLFRSGLLGFATLFCVLSLLSQLPLMLHPPAWLTGSTVLMLLAMALPVAWGFWFSHAGRPLFRDEILERA